MSLKVLDKVLKGPDMILRRPLDTEAEINQGQEREAQAHRGQTQTVQGQV